jgi:hypothetical protein
MFLNIKYIPQLIEGHEITDDRYTEASFLFRMLPFFSLLLDCGDLRTAL